VNNKKGVLLLNLGSPARADVSSIRAFLKDFLLDPRVVDLPAWLRYTLIYGVILPFRPKKILPQYQEIWLDAGSPLHVHTTALCDALSAQMGDNYLVLHAMRYGAPSIADALSAFECAGVDNIRLVPLFPQYASSTTGSVFAEVFRQLRDYTNIPVIQTVNDYYDAPFFIQSMARSYQKPLETFKADFVLFSYHGLPYRHIAASERQGFSPCEDNLPCPAVFEKNRYCYRAQCYASSKALAKSLWLGAYDYQTVFQSRFGRARWIRPATDEVLVALREKGVSRLAVACPSFLCDCLETLEEIGIRLKDQWCALGGTDFLLLPSLNAEDAFVRAFAKWLHRLE
jgi:protoporphyrin/coproporphyrin ferrochelatase